MIFYSLNSTAGAHKGAQGAPSCPAANQALHMNA
jgi:hypothetical protein